MIIVSIPTRSGVCLSGHHCQDLGRDDASLLVHLCAPLRQGAGCAVAPRARLAARIRLLRQDRRTSRLPLCCNRWKVPPSLGCRGTKPYMLCLFFLFYFSSTSLFFLSPWLGTPLPLSIFTPLSKTDKSSASMFETRADLSLASKPTSLQSLPYVLAIKYPVCLELPSFSQTYWPLT